MLPKITHQELPDFIDLCVKTGDNLLIVGEPGIGKTVGIVEYAKENGFGLQLAHPAVEDPTDIKGYPAKATRVVTPEQDALDCMLNGEEPAKPVTQDIATFLPFGNMLKIMDAREPMFWFIDDFGQSPYSLQAGYMQFLGSRELCGNRIPDCVHIIAATNGREHKAGVKGLLEPVKSRFGYIVELVPDQDSFRDYWFKKQLPHVVTDFLNYTPGALCDFKPNVGMEKSPCPRLWEKLGKALQLVISLQTQGAGNPTFVEKMCVSAVGEEYGRQFYAFLKLYAKLPRYEEVVADPEDFPIDHTLDIRYAMLGMLANKGELRHSKQLFTYIEKLKKEYQVIFMRTLAAMKSPLVKSKEARTWVASNPQIYLTAIEHGESF